MTAGRIGALDVARGLAVLAMVVFHLTWDLGHFGYIDASIPWSAPFRAFGHAIAFSFLFIAGVSLVLAHRQRMRWRAFWRRFAIVAGAAGLVSVGTYLVFPTAFVFFGILHVIAAASLLSAPFLFLPWQAALAVGAVFFAAPHFLASPLFDAGWLQWLGLGKTVPLTQDWRPLFPWAGAMILGVGAGRLLPLPVYGERVGARGEAKIEIISAEGPAVADRPPSWLTPLAPHPGPLPVNGEREGWLAFLGRHSLLIYLVHQPLLFALFTGLVMLVPPPEDAQAFVAACERGCIEEGASQGFCRDACICTQREAERTRALAGVKDDETRGKILREIAGKCAGKT